MPVIERYPIGGQVRRQAAPTVFLNNRRPVNLSVANNALSLGRGFDRAQVELEKLEEEADAESALSAQVKIERIRRDLLFTPNTGAMHLNGKNASGVSSTVVEALDKAYKDELSQLGSNRAKTMLRSQYLPVRANTHQSLMQHESVEQERALLETLEARKTGLVEDVAADAMNSTTVATALVKGQDAIRAQGQLLGHTDEVVEENLERYRSTVHETAVVRMLDQNPRWAAAYFKEHKGDIDGQRQKALEKAVKVGTTSHRGQQLTDRLLAKYGEDTAGALNEARATLQGKERDQVVRRLTARHNEARAMRAQGHQDAAREAQVWIDTNPGVPVEEMPPTLFARVIDSGKLSDVRKSSVERNAQPVDTARLHALETLRIRDPKAFLALDFSGELGRLGDEGLKLYEMQRNARFSGFTSNQKVSDAATKDWLGDNKHLLIEAGIDFGTGSKVSAKDAARFNKLDAYLLGRMRDFQQQNNGTMPPREIREQWVKEAIREVYVGDPGTSILGLEFGATKKPRFEVTPEDVNPRAVRSVGDIPPADMQRIGRYLDRWNAARKAKGQRPVNKMERAMAIYNAEVEGRTPPVQ